MATKTNVKKPNIIKFGNQLGKIKEKAKKTAIIGGIAALSVGGLTSCEKDNFEEPEKTPIFVDAFSTLIETEILSPDDFEASIDLVHDSIFNVSDRFNSKEHPMFGEYFYKSDIKIHSKTMEVNVNKVRTLVYFQRIFEMSTQKYQWQTYMTLFVDPNLKLINLNLDQIRKDYEDYSEWTKNNDFVNYHTWDEYYNSIYKPIIEDIRKKGYRINIVYHSKSAEKSSAPVKGSTYLPKEFYPQNLKPGR